MGIEDFLGHSLKGTPDVTKGSLTVGAAPGVFTSLQVGANGTALVADSTQPSGTAWGSPAGSLPGVTVTGTPAVGQLIIASTAAAATWKDPPFVPIAQSVAAVNNAIVPHFATGATGVAQAGSFASLFISQTFGGVLETSWSLGYNPEQQRAGEIASWLKWLPNCGDTTALEFECPVQFSDGAILEAFVMKAALSTTHSIKWTFSMGKGSSDFIQFTDGFNAALLTLYPEATAGGSFVVWGAKTVEFAPPAGDYLRLMFKPPAGQYWFLDFFAGGGGSPNWQITSNATANIYFTDLVNGVVPLLLTAGAGVNGKVTLGSVLYPVQAATASAPAYVKGGLYFDTTLNKLRVGGAAAWETVTSA